MAPFPHRESPPDAGLPDAGRPARILALCLLVGLGAAAPGPAATVPILSGAVRDAETGNAVDGAAIGLPGAAAATLSDSTGAFRLSVPAFPTVLVVERAGYQSQELAISGPAAAPLEVLLIPDPYEMAETVVRYEDPAVRIMRQVIEGKRQWQARLHTWTAEAYTRQTLYADTRIVALREQRSRLYRDRERGEREVVLAGRHSAGVPDSLQYFAASAYFANLYDDEIEVLGQRVLGPTNPAALDHYRFELTGSQPVEGDTLYEISVRPRGALRTVLAGYLLVRQSAWAVVEARLALAPPVVTPRVPSRDGLRLRFTQHFAAFADGIQLPVDLEYELDAHLGTSALGERVLRWRNDPTPRARLQGRCRLSAHRVNGRISEFVYLSPGPLEMDGLAAADSLVRPHQAALTPAEEQAYAHLERFPRPLGNSPVVGLFALYPGLAQPGAAGDAARPGPFAAESLVSKEVVIVAAAQGLGMTLPPLPDGEWVPQLEPEVWYNRVEGLHAGGRAHVVPNGRVGLSLKGGYALGIGRAYGGAGLTLGDRAGPTLAASYQTGVNTSYDSDTYSLAGNSFPVLLGIGDYFDYYWSRRWRLELGSRRHESGPHLLLGWNRETHTSLVKSTDFDLLCDFQPESGHFYQRVCAGRDRDFRDNPPIRPGRLRSLDLRAEWGEPYVARGRALNRRVELLAEYAGRPLGGDLYFRRLQVIADGHWDTIARRRAGVGGLDLRLIA